MSLHLRTIKDIRTLIAKELTPVYPAREISSLTNIIIKTCLTADRLHHLTEPDLEVSPVIIKKILSIIKELKAGKPVQYVLGETVFYNCRIKLNKKTFIPRQETEELVDLVIEENRGFKGKILDIGTGSGCIAIAIAKNIPDSEVTAVDNSEEALEAGRLNARLNNVKLDFLNVDILNPQNDNLLPLCKIIISNPPYVLESEKEYMHRNVLDFEPSNALFVPDDDPLIYYRKILELLGTILEPSGKIYFEINELMGESMKNIMINASCSNPVITKDINGKDRIIKGIYDG